MARALSGSSVDDGLLFDGATPFAFTFDARGARRSVAWEAFVAQARARGIPSTAPQLLRAYEDVPKDAPASRYEQGLRFVQAAVEAELKAREVRSRRVAATPWARRLLAQSDASSATSTEGVGSMELDG